MNKILAASVAFGSCSYLYWNLSRKHSSTKLLASSENVTIKYKKPLPTRTELLKKLQRDETFDVLVIGGGATGCGIALDASTRGLKTALVEKYDYASGTSSRSTKLVHGGVRYLQKAIMKLDREQYRLVKEALYERANVLKSAPHLSGPLPILLPVYKWWQVPYFYAGIKMYDLVAGRQLVKKSYFLNKEKALEQFPMLKQESLCGAIVYYDGQMNDARMNLTIALTAIRNGAACSNYVEVKQLLFEQVNGEKRVCGAHVQDLLTGNEWDIKAKCVINATGPFTDTIRRMDNEDTPAICLPSSGIHITLPEYYCPQKYGLLDPASSDGRVIFFLPWEGKTVVGTTDRKCDISHNPSPTEEDIQFVLKEIQKYLNQDIKVRRGDVLSAWSGIRPLVLDPSSKDTQSLSRNHITDISESKLITIAGGKWTTYRAMAKDTVDVAVKALDLKTEKECHTDHMFLEGAEGWTPTYFIRLTQEFGMEADVAEHLAHSYGVKAPQVVKLANISGKRWPVLGRRLCEDYPFIEAEVIYGVRNEYACTVVDMVSRRLRIAFLDTKTTSDILPKVIKLMGDELNWDKNKRNSELEAAQAFLQTMGYKNITDDVTADTITAVHQKDNERFQQIFNAMDKNGSGQLKRSDLKQIFKSIGNCDVNDKDLTSMIADVNNDDATFIDLKSFVKLMSMMREGKVTNNKLGVLVRKHFLVDDVNSREV